ncbi:MAG: 50S ribosomal protein L9 [Gemmatimonadota bacterium]
MVEIILRTAVENLGEAGDVVDVKPGYARNYLIPRGFALPASAGNRKRLAQELQRGRRSRERQKEQAEQLAQELQGRTLTFEVLIGGEGRLFGSVTSADIAEALAGEGVEVDRHSIQLSQPIKELGVYDVPIRLHPEVKPEIRVSVVAKE